MARISNACIESHALTSKPMGSGPWAFTHNHHRKTFPTCSPTTSYFTLNDPTDETINSLVAACHQYLKDHPGVVFFAAGTLVEELNRPVNDRDFHVALHVVFDNKASHDAYQTAEDHLKFISENKDGWKQVRVFDSYVES